MKLFIAIGAGLLIISCSEKHDAPTVKSILLEQLKNTHTNKDWYVPINVAVEGLTAEQANQKDTSSNHSVGELVSHLVFWNERILLGFHKKKAPEFNDDNEVTFKTFNEKDWADSIKKLDSIQTAWEESVEEATETQLKEWSASIANICTHNAYHTGQIVYIRKQNGWWHDWQGVK
jgi:uncharacterized damage-inducible protein DinB